MKSRLFKLTIFLLLGAIVNVAVAWGCAMSIEVNGRGSNRIFVFRYIYPDHSRNKGALILIRFSKPGAVRLKLYYNSREKPSDSRVLGQPESLVPNWAQDQLMPWKNDSTFYSEEDRLRRLFKRHIDARGWPMYSVWCAWVGLADPIEGGIQLPDRWTSQHDQGSYWPTTLPLRPIWPGFAINTIFYAAILWLLSLGPFTVRRIFRRKRGQCINCCYDLRGLTLKPDTRCPECGELVLNEKANSTD